MRGKKTEPLESKVMRILTHASDELIEERGKWTE
jgi:hypothetical protein